MIVLVPVFTAARKGNMGRCGAGTLSPTIKRLWFRRGFCPLMPHKYHTVAPPTAIQHKYHTMVPSAAAQAEQLWCWWGWSFCFCDCVQVQVLVRGLRVLALRSQPDVVFHSCVAAA